MAGAGFGDMDFECFQFSMAGVALFDMGLQFSWQAQDLVTWILIDVEFSMAGVALLTWVFNFHDRRRIW